MAMIKREQSSKRGRTFPKQRTLGTRGKKNFGNEWEKQSSKSGGRSQSKELWEREEKEQPECQCVIFAIMIIHQMAGKTFSSPVWASPGSQKLFPIVFWPQQGRRNFFRSYFGLSEVAETFSDR